MTSWLPIKIRKFLFTSLASSMIVKIDPGVERGRVTISLIMGSKNKKNAQSASVCNNHSKNRKIMVVADVSKTKVSQSKQALSIVHI